MKSIKRFKPNKLVLWAILLLFAAGGAYLVLRSLATASLVTDPNAIYSVPSVSKPNYLTSFTDSTFGTNVQRIAGNSGATINFSSGGSGTWGADARQHYNDDQAWNADSSLLALQNESGGTPSLIFLDGKTYQPKFGICSAYASVHYDDRWHTTMPNVRINRNNGTELSWWDVVNCTKLRSWTLPFPATMDSEAGPSRDGSLYALGDGTRVFVVKMDPSPGKVGPAFDFSASCGLTDCTADHISISPSGKYVVIQYTGDHDRVLDVDQTTLTLTPHVYASGTPECSGHDPAKGYIFDAGHDDLNFDLNGDDVLVAQNRSWCPQTVNGVALGQVYMMRLKDGALTSLIKPDSAQSYHISCRNLDRPGWCYASFYPSSGKTYNDEILAVKLDGSGAVERLVHDHTDTTSCYRCESHPVPSRDGNRVLFASSWSAACGTVCGTQSNPQAYIVDSTALRGGGSTDTTPPTVSITSPTNGSTFTTSPVTINATAADNTGGGGVAKVDFKVDGTIVGTDTTSPYSYSWVTSSVPNGTHTITAVATDVAGNPATSSSVSVTINNPISSGPADEIHYTVTGPNSITFDWRGNPTDIRFGTTTAYGQTQTAVSPNITPYSSNGPWREAKLTGLTSGTLYHYSIGGGADHTFKAPPTSGSSGFSVAALADIGDSTSYSNMPIIADMIPGLNPDFILAAGDLTYANDHGTGKSDIHFNDVMVWSQDRAYEPAWGNHEWDNQTYDDLRNYKGRFDFANPQTSPGSPTVSCCGEDWHWFDYGNTRFIAYPEPWSGAVSDWGTKVTPIMDAAQTDPNIKFIVTFGHRPAYSSGHHPGESTLKGIIDNLGATHSKYVLNINGHSHDYERTTPQSGVTHLTVGTGGAGLEQDSGGSACGNIWYVCPAPSFTAKRFMRQGVTLLSFGANSINGSFICGPPGGGTNDVTCTKGDVIDSFSIGTGDTTKPTVAITSPTNGAVVTGSSTITASASDDIGVTKVEFYIDGLLKNTDTASPYSFSWDSTTVGNGSHTISSTAYDAGGNTASNSISVTTSNGDTTAPSAPTSLKATAISATQVNLSWTASTDNVGVAGYYIIRDGVTITQVGSVTSYSDTSVSPSTSYSYSVKAFDAAGNTSIGSNVASITTPSVQDSTAPSAPTNLTATAVSSTQINLSWTASTDNVGVTGYDVYRDGIKISTISTTSFGDTGLSPSTSYSYYVIAKDASNNSSSPSASATAVTQSAQTTAGTINGVVSDSTGGMIVGAKISLSFNGSTHTYTSDSTGSYSITAIPAGNYSITYSAKHYKTQKLNVTVAGNVTTTQNVTLTKR